MSKKRDEIINYNRELAKKNAGKKCETIQAGDEDVGIWFQVANAQLFYTGGKIKVSAKGRKKTGWEGEYNIKAVAKDGIIDKEGKTEKKIYKHEHPSPGYILCAEKGTQTISHYPAVNGDIELTATNMISGKSEEKNSNIGLYITGGLIAFLIGFIIFRKMNH